MQNLTVIALCVILAVVMSSCNDKFPLKINWDGLKGTQWKLEYIVDMSGGSYEKLILAPQDCDTCYTLTFDAEKKWYISGVSILNTLSIEFSILLSSSADMDISVTDMDEPFDGNLYCSLIRSVTGINTDVKNSLILFIKNKDTGSNSYILIYKRLNP